MSAIVVRDRKRAVPHAGRGRERFHVLAAGSGYRDEPADVARDGFTALMEGEERVVSHSLKTKIQAASGRLMPDSVKSAMHAKMAEPGSADD